MNAGTATTLVAGTAAQSYAPIKIAKTVNQMKTQTTTTDPLMIAQTITTITAMLSHKISALKIARMTHSSSK